MKVHHLDCGPLASGIVTHCLLVETADALVLVDSGFGTADLAEPDRRLGWTRRVLAPRLDPEHTALRQVEALGYDPRDVGHIVLTHLDYDHAGGISDFPSARIHVHGPELRAAAAPTGSDRWRYRTAQWAHGPRWSIHERGGAEWFGFPGVTAPGGLPPELRLVPLYGHTAGHVGVAIDTGDRWLLHAGDAFVSELQLHRLLPGLLLAGAAFGVPEPRLAAARVRTLHRLAELTRLPGGPVTVFAAHDPITFARLANQPEGEPSCAGL
ncbi:MBL fold metallo-hydrolase [Nocardia sp. NPDC057227]|uniref:MBL fold metallo-hydrolase n=1 Tax=Nocardia sp. NPDC057227 TaxID=3346056 RepID=UPI003627AAE2